MSVIKTVVTDFCFSASVSFILKTVMPEKQKKTFAIICTAVIIFCVCSPLAGKKLSFDLPSVFDENDFSYAEEETLTGIQSAFEKEIYKKTEETLINNGVTEYEIYITSEKDEKENTVNLTGVKVVLGESFKAEKETVYKSLSGEYKNILTVEVKNDG